MPIKVVYARRKGPSSKSPPKPVKGAKASKSTVKKGAEDLSSSMANMPHLKSAMAMMPKAKGLSPAEKEMIEQRARMMLVKKGGKK